MKFKIMVLSAVMSTGALVAEAGEYLYWMIDVAQEYAFSYATVSSANGDLLKNFSGDPTEAEGEQYIGASNTAGTKTERMYAYDVSSYVGSSFIFELFNESEQSVGYQTVTYAFLKENSHIGSGRDQIGAYVVSDVIPEPTSGLLVLFGLAGLALRRRRV